MDRRERMNDPEEALRAALDGRQAATWVMMPGIIESFDAEKVTAVVQPAIMGLQRSSSGQFTYVNMPLCLDCPVVFQQGGGFVLTFPIQPGDECEIRFASRCIDAWWQQGGVQPPMELRMNDLSDGFVTVGPRSQVRLIPNISTTKAQLRTVDGDVYLEIDKTGSINLVAPVSVTFDTPLAVFTGSVHIEKDQTVDGDSTVTGTVTGKVEVVMGPSSIRGSEHKHTGVQSGPSNTGGPVN